MYTLYIGSNNETGKLEDILIYKIVDEYFKGFTCYPVLGHWNGMQENSMKVEIATDDLTKIQYLCKELKNVLKQESIMLVENTVLISFI